ncbi:MAG: hypothetical protein NT077_01935 [Candidatus Taylorbacteria bacterium]|nr:hypothetical protein [Candidatus Taylorbacteria bacterium]
MKPVSKVYKVIIGLISVVGLLFYANILFMLFVGIGFTSASQRPALLVGGTLLFSALFLFLIYFVIKIFKATYSEDLYSKFIWIVIIIGCLLLYTWILSSLETGKQKSEIQDRRVHCKEVPEQNYVCNIGGKYPELKLFSCNDGSSSFCAAKL